MSVSKVVGCRAKGSLLYAVVSSLVIAAAAADETVIEVFEPSPLYQGADSCRYYDLVQNESLTFNVTASRDSTDSWVLIVKKSTAYWALDGGTCVIDSCTDSCSLSCTAKDGDEPTADPYAIVAERSNGQPLQASVVCVRVQDTVWVRFVGEQPINLTSGDGRVDLSFSADGYPQPLSYELSCTGLPQSRVLSNTTGNFTLTELPDGVTSCTAVAYTGRRLAVTEPLLVLIRVNATSQVVVATDSSATYSSATGDVSSANSSLSASSSTTNVTVKASPVLQQDSVKGLLDERVLVAAIVPCVVVVISVALSVGLGISYRRRHALKGSPVISAGSTAPTTPCESLPSGQPYLVPATVINNSITNHNYYGDTYEINGPGSSVAIIKGGVGHVSSFDDMYKISGPGSSVILVNDGVGCVRSPQMLHHDERDADEPSTANHIQHVQEVDATCCQPSPTFLSASASMLCSVELDNDETAFKYPCG